MAPDDIRVAFENAVGIPEEAMHAAISQSAEFAPLVIALVQSMAEGRLPLPHEEKLLRFGLHALAAAREATACSVFLALLRRSEIELDWLFGEDHTTPVAQLLLGLFDGNEAAVSELIADRAVDEDVRNALMLALARLVWEGHASRERLLALLERVQHGWDAGRMAYSFRDVDRKDWLERVRAAAEDPDDPQRFVKLKLVPVEDPAQSVGWSAIGPHKRDDALDEDELAWLDLALLRTVPENRCLEEADGLLTALAAGPARATSAEYLPDSACARGDVRPRLA